LIVTCPDCPGAMVSPDGEAASQTNEGKGIAVTCQLSALCPLLVMVTTWPVGFASPWTVLKFRLSGEALMTGAVGVGATWTVNCTNTVSVLCPKTNERSA